MILKSTCINRNLPTVRTSSEVVAADTLNLPNDSDSDSILDSLLNSLFYLFPIKHLKKKIIYTHYSSATIYKNQEVPKKTKRN